MINESVINVNFCVVGKVYWDKLWSFMFNLRDKINVILCVKIVDGSIFVVELFNMFSEELVNDVRWEEVERRKKESLE